MTYVRVALAAVLGLVATAPLGALVAQASAPADHQDGSTVAAGSACPDHVTDKRIYFVTCGGFF